MRLLFDIIFYTCLCLPGVSLNDTGCANETAQCVGLNVVCVNNTCVCEDGYRESSGECIPRKKLCCEFIVCFCICYFAIQL